jgi:hypothetical protein
VAKSRVKTNKPPPTTGINNGNRNLFPLRRFRKRKLNQALMKVKVERLMQKKLEERKKLRSSIKPCKSTHGLPWVAHC